MKPRTLREMTRDELAHKRMDLLDEQFNLKMRRSLKPLENPLLLRQVRRDIARIDTILLEDERGVRKLAESKKSILDGSEKNK